MYLNKSAVKVEVNKILNTSKSDLEIAQNIVNLWGGIIRTMYNDDGIHNINWFINKAAQNKIDKDKNPALKDKWKADTLSAFKNPDDITGVLKAIEGYGTLNVASNGKTLLDIYAESCDVVNASFMFALQQTGCVQTPEPNSPLKKDNTILKIMQSSPEIMKMLLCFYPKTCSNRETLSLLKDEIYNVRNKLTDPDDRARFDENRELYHDFMIKNNMYPVFAKEDMFADGEQTNQNIQGNVRDFVERVMAEKEQSKLTIGEERKISPNQNSAESEQIVSQFVVNENDFENTKQDEAITRYSAR